jgi:predicted DNA-binding protein (MmcQ/YjbR family)
MTLQRIRDICLALPDATEQIQWGKDLVFKVGGKMFCVACTEPVAPPKVALSFKCDDETFAELVERAGVIPAPYMAQHKWVAPEQFDTLGAAELEKLIVRAYEIVKAKLGKPRPAGRRTPARKAATKTAAKKTAAKKTAAKKTAAKKTATRKPARKTAARKAAKTSARRATRAPARRAR